MRFTSILGVAIVVVLVIAAVLFGLRNTSVPEETGSALEGDEAPVPTAGSGQFFQAVPGEGVIEEMIVTEEGEEPTLSVPEAVTITMSESGFSPAEVTVAPGTAVTFVNDGQANHWPASDVHPTHTVLPGFDAKRGLATGETYTYAFEEVGTWRCHDHLMPHFTCVVIVK